jgi:acetylornithine deacetylase
VNATCKVAFGTEGGLFARDLGIPTIVCGPGSMDQGHKPDEFVTAAQLALCDDMLASLTSRLQAGLKAGLWAGLPRDRHQARP